MGSYRSFSIRLGLASVPALCRGIRFLAGVRLASVGQFHKLVSDRTAAAAELDGQFDPPDRLCRPARSARCRDRLSIGSGGNPQSCRVPVPLVVLLLGRPSEREQRILVILMWFWLVVFALPALTMD